LKRRWRLLVEPMGRAGSLGRLLAGLQQITLSVAALDQETQWGVLQFIGLFCASSQLGVSKWLQK